MALLFHHQKFVHLVYTVLIMFHDPNKSKPYTTPHPKFLFNFNLVIVGNSVEWMPEEILAKPINRV